MRFKIIIQIRLRYRTFLFKSSKINRRSCSTYFSIAVYRNRCLIHNSFYTRLSAIRSISIAIIFFESDRSKIS